MLPRQLDSVAHANLRACVPAQCSGGGSWRQAGLPSQRHGSWSQLNRQRTRSLGGVNMRAVGWLKAIGEDRYWRFVSRLNTNGASEFRALDDGFTKVTPMVAPSSARSPTADNLQRNSEWGVLRRGNHQAHAPAAASIARRDSVGGAETPPCLLMSPLSIAQYLSADASRFDLVISTRPLRFRCGMHRSHGSRQTSGDGRRSEATSAYEFLRSR